METNSNITSINYIVWSATEEDANALGQKLIGVTPNNGGVFTKQEKDYTLSGFTRWSKSHGGKQPVNGTVDVLVLHFPTSSDDLKDSAKDYVNTRKGIPFRFVVSPDDLTDWAKEQGLTYWGAEANSELLNQSLKAALELDTTLRKTFALFDVDKSNYISKENLIKISGDLGHQLNQEEAKEISNTIAEDGKISYDRFKYWWLAGRQNFSQFRNLVEMEMSVNNLVKKGSGMFGEYLEKVNKELASNKDLGEGLVSRIDLRPKKDFDNGISLSINVSAGSEAKNIINALPDYFHSSSFTYSLELTLKNPDLGPTAVQQLEQAKEMIFQIVPNFNQAVEMGLMIKFRNAGKSVFVDFALGGAIGDMVSQQLNNFNVENANFSGVSSMHLISGLKLDRPFECSFDEMIEMLTQFKVQGHGEASNYKPLINLLVNLLSTTYQHMVPSKVRFVFNLIKLFSSLRNFEYTLEYDSEELAKNAKELIGSLAHNKLGQAEWDQINPELGIQMLGGVVAQGQGQGKGTLEGLKPTALGFLAPFLDTLKGLDLDRISLGFCSSKFSLYYRMTLCLVGLTEFLNNNILNDE